MSLRVTQQTLMDQAVQSSRLRNQAIAELQNQIATGLRITKPSDDPANVSVLLLNKASDARMDVDLDNISSARLKLNRSVTQLTDASDVFTSAREIALGALQTEEKETLAQQIDGLIVKLLAIANRTDNGDQLFSGSASHDKPFNVVEKNAEGRPQVIQYFGAERRSQVLVAPNTPVDTLYPGSEVFVQTTRGETAYFGITGATAGHGTDSARGQGELTVRHTLTTYEAGAGVGAGASSVSGDTIIGAHQLTIEDHPDLGRVARLDGGGPWPFDASSVDLKVEGPSGGAVYVDLSGVAASFTGDVVITANGTLSIDGGNSEVAIDFSANQTLINSQTGEVTNVDSAGIRRTGVDRVEYGGTADAFEALMQLRDQLRDTEGISTTELRRMMDFRIQDLELVQDQILHVVGEQSVALENLDALEYRTQDVQLETRVAIGKLENADMAEVILRLQNEQNMLQFIYASAASIHDNSLLDFLR